ncbi:MAG: terminase large subunit [Defluviitaleaceae bacterium]|nr:terminase large subunit [Defluviitaleaceae bacterium]
MPSQNYILDYYSELKSGKAIAGKLVHTVYETILEHLECGEYFYDTKKAYKAITFIENYCRHSKGRNDLLKLESWQKAAIASIFGLVDEYGLRVYREVFIVVARKNGKSLLMAAIASYAAFLDGEYGGEIYCLATKLDQTEHVWSSLMQIIEKEPLLKIRTKKRKNDIYIEESNTVIKPLVFSPKSSDGFNLSLAINDELHAWAGNRGLMLYNVITSGLGSRLQPLVISISTAGHENDGIYDEIMRRSSRFLNRDSRERRLLSIIYMIDDPLKWNDLGEIAKANPNLDVSVPTSYFENEIAKAEAEPNHKREFLMKYCNIKQSQTVAWLDNRLLEAAKANKTLEDFRGCYGVGGFDLSQSGDLTAASIAIEKGGKIYTFCQFYMPKNRIQEAIQEDNVPYDLYVREGILKLSGENMVDYRDIYDWFVDLKENKEIYLLKIGYDRYAAGHLLVDLKTYGFHLDDVWQGENLAPVIREFEGSIKDGDFYIVNNNLLKAHLLNVTMKHNLEKRTFRPVKIEKRKRIDGFVAVINALTVRQKYYGEISGMLKNEGR